MAREKEIRETLEKTLKINEGSSNGTPFVSFEVAGGFVNCLSVYVYPDGWHGLTNTKNESYVVYLDAFDESEYKRMHNELDKLIKEKEQKVC
jgi:hypothetical protein